MQRSADNFFYDPQDGVLSQRIAQALDLEGEWEGEVWCRRDDGEACQVRLSWVASRDSLGMVTNTIGIFRDLSEKLAAHRRIEQLAYSDALTGVPNRLALAQRVGVSTAADTVGPTVAGSLIGMGRNGHSVAVSPERTYGASHAPTLTLSEYKERANSVLKEFYISEVG